MEYVPINHIVILDGKPRIAGRRITVQDIVAIYIWSHSPIEWIEEQYDLTRAQIYAALAYYYDHQAEMDEEFRRGEELVEEMLRSGKMISSDELLAKMRVRKQELERQKTEGK